MKVYRDNNTRKKVIIFTALGMVLVLVVWGFQLSYMFAEVSTSTARADIAKTATDFKEAQSLTESVKRSMPILELSFAELIAQLGSQKVEKAKEEAISTVSEELVNKFDDWQMQAQGDLQAEEQANIVTPSSQ